MRSVSPSVRRAAARKRRPGPGASAMVSLAPADQVSGGLISGPQVLLSLHQLPVGNRLAWRGQEMGEQEAPPVVPTAR